MKFEAFKAAETSIEPEKWQGRIIEEARELYKRTLGEMTEEEREMALNGFDGFARGIVARKKEEWSENLNDGGDPEKKELELAKGLLIAAKNEMEKLQEAA
jgi:hypothetical protein